MWSRPTASRTVQHTLLGQLLQQGNDESRAQQHEDLNLATARARQTMRLKAQLEGAIRQGRIPGRSTAAVAPAAPVAPVAPAAPVAVQLQQDRLQSQERLQAAQLAAQLQQVQARTQGQQQLNQQQADLDEQRRRDALSRALAVVNATRAGNPTVKTA